MKKLMIAVAGAVAMTASAFAGEWFKPAISDYADWPVTNATDGGVWENYTSASLVDGDNGKELEVAATKDTALMFTAKTFSGTGVKADNTVSLDSSTKVEFTSTIEFTPFTSDDEFKNNTDMKAGVVAVKEGNFWALVAGDNCNTWSDTSIATTKDPVEVKVTIEKVDDAFQITYKIGDSTFGPKKYWTGTGDANKTLAGVSYIGDGVVSALEATEVSTPQPFDVPEIANTTWQFWINGDLAGEGATNATFYAGNNDKIKYLYTTIDPSFSFSDGSHEKGDEGKMNEIGKIDTKKYATTQAAARIGDDYFKTIYDAIAAVTNADMTLTLCKGDMSACTEDVVFNAVTNLTVDLGGNTVACDYAFIAGAACNGLTITNGTLNATLAFLNGSSNITLTNNVTVAGNSGYNTSGSILIFGDVQNVAISGTVTGVDDGEGNVTAIYALDDPNTETPNTSTIVIDGATIDGAISMTTAAEEPGYSLTINVGSKLDKEHNEKTFVETYKAADTKVVENGDYWEVKEKGEEPEGVAKIGDKYYETLDAALTEADNGDTVTLLKDIETSAAQQWTLAKNITIDFATYTITKKVANDWVFTVAKGADVIFTGTTGGINHKPAALNQTNPASMIQILGKLTVTGGAYESDYTIFKVDEDDTATHTAKGELVVTGGTFTITDEPKYSGQTFAVMNWSKATINGGAFSGRVVTLSNDGNNCSKAGETIVGSGVTGAPTYVLKVSGSTYANVPKIKGVDIDDVTLVKSASITDDLALTVSGDYVTVGKAAAKIGSVFYVTLADALDAAEAGDTVTLVADIETAAAQQWTLAKDITIDFATYTITKTVANDWVFTVAKDADVIFTGTTGGINHKPAALNQVNPASMIQILGKLTVNGGAYESDYTIFKVDEDDAATHTAKGELVVTGGTFTITDEPKYSGQTFAVMNWSKATINGGAFSGRVVTLSNDGNACSKAGETIIGSGVTGTPTYVLKVSGSTYNNVPKIKGVAKANVTLVYDTTKITDELELVEKEGYVTVAKKSGGDQPTPAAGSDAKVEQATDEKGQPIEDTYVVTPTGDSKTVVLDNVKADDTIVVNGEKVDTIGGVDADQVVITNTVESGIDISAAFMATNRTSGAVGVDIVLNPAGVVKVSETESIPVTPEVNAAAAKPIDPSASATSATVAGHTIPGLTYQLTRCEDLAAGKFNAIGNAVKAESTSTTLTDTDKPANKAFYKINVTK